MKYAVTYLNNPSTFDKYSEIDEISFPFFDDEVIMPAITTFIKPWQTIIINLANEREKPFDEIYPTLEWIHEHHENLIVKIDLRLQRHLITPLLNHNIRFFFRNFVTDFSTLATMQQLGACAAYLTEDICFNLDRAQYYREKGMRLRVFPDVIQVAKGAFNQPNINNFFIRPEDTATYEKYVDVFEFFRKDNHLETIVEIYKKRKWLGKLSQIIIDYDDDSVSNEALPPLFGGFRTNCRKRCLENKCQLCSTSLAFAETLESGNMSFDYPTHTEMSAEKKQELIQTAENWRRNYEQEVQNQREQSQITKDDMHD